MTTPLYSMNETTRGINLVLCECDNAQKANKLHTFYCYFVRPHPLTVTVFGSASNDDGERYE